MDLPSLPFMKNKPWIPRAGARGGKGFLSLRIQYNALHDTQTNEPCGIDNEIPSAMGRSIASDIERNLRDAGKGIVSRYNVPRLFRGIVRME